MDWNTKAVRASMLLLLTLIAYAPSLRSGFVWDDDRYVTNNPTLGSTGGLARIWSDPAVVGQYYPLVETTFWIEHHLWGDNPFGYHFVNIVLHLLNTLLLWFLLEGLGVAGAWLAAAIFALHPVHVESVAWITERKDVLSGLFYLLAMAAFLRYYGVIDRPAAAARKLYATGFAFFLCALLSKSVTATLPVALLIVLWWKRDRIRRADVWPLVPLMAVGAGLGLMTVWLEKNVVGARGDLWNLSLVQRFLLAGRALWFYAGKLLWPAPLSFFYPKWQIDSAAWWSYLFPLVAVGLAVGLWAARGRIGKGPFAATAFFGVTLFPALGFFDIYPMQFSWVADHFQYLASIGPIVLAAALASMWASQLGAAAAQAAPVAAYALLVVLCGLSWRQSLIYKDAETLWRDTIAKNPASWTPHNNLGVLLMARGQVQDAIREYNEAARLSPESWMPHRNLGAALRKSGQRPEAIREYEEALKLNPEVIDAHVDLANLLAETGSIAAAIGHYQQAMSRDPKNPAIPYDLGVTLLEAGRAPAAIEPFEQTLRLDPSHTGARTGLGDALAQLGRTGEAIEQYTEALRRDPSAPETHNNLGNALVKWGKHPEALEHYRQALRLKPDYAQAANNLGLALTHLNRLPEAIEAYRDAIRIQPEFAEAHNNLGVVLANSNQLPEAIEQFEQAVKLKPDFTSAQGNLEATRKMAAAAPSKRR
jgi:tetratricopeptide (TPR) repeat protein